MNKAKQTIMAIITLTLMATGVMADTKAEFLSDLASNLGDGFVIKGSLSLLDTVTNYVDDANVMTRYYVNVATTGKDKSDASGIGQRRSLEFYVVDEGTTNEYACAKDKAWTNPENQAWSGSTLAAKALIYNNSELRSRVTAAMLGAAFDIINEAGTVTNHAERVLLAGKVMMNDVTYEDAFMFFVSVNATVQSAGPGGASDNDIQYIVNSNWNNVAKAVGLITG